MNVKQVTFKSRVFTVQDVLNSMQRFDNERRKTFNSNRWRVYAIEHNRKLYPPKEIMSIATGLNVGDFVGGEPVNNRFQKLGFRITTISKKSGQAATVGYKTIPLFPKVNGLVNQLNELESGTLYRFSDWPNELVPRVAIGVYTVWDATRFMYVGMGGRTLDPNKVVKAQNSRTKPRGLYKRLRQHGSGRRGGDQFCIYVCDRCVLRELTGEQIELISENRLSLDRITKDYIHKHFQYRFAEVGSPETASTLENRIKRGALASGEPFLNPS